MVRFPSAEWVEKFKDAVNSSKSYAESAKTWEGDFLFGIKADGALKRDFFIYMDLYHGECRQAHVIEDPTSVKTEFVYSGMYSNWLKLINKEIDPIKGLMTGKFKLTGNMAKVMRYVRAAKELVNCTTMVEAEYL
jgi:putative sterol carrier protein